MSDLLSSKYQNFKVLVVEDNKFIRDLVCSLLGQIGFKEILRASDGEVALMMLESKGKPDLVICDIDMKPMDGFAFMDRLRELGHKGTFKSPTIVLTSHAETDFVKKAKEFEIEAYLVKPVSKTSLETRIATTLGKRL
jgi:two-component system chemotaxis response regulator CheY